MTVMSKTALGLMTAAALTVASAASADVKLPKTMAWTAYGTGSAGHAQAVAIGKALKEKYGTNLRVLPGKNDVARLRPLQTGKVDAVANGAGTYFAQEGVFGFDKADWGPMPVRILLTSKGSAGLMVGVAADTGVKTLADLKGKRVAWVKSAPALNHNVTAFLAFAGLGWDDVEKVEFAGFGASWDGMAANQVDAAFAITVSGKAKPMAANPRGLVWPATPHGDSAGWNRMLSMAPYFTKNAVKIGAAVPEGGIEGMAYPYPILTVRADMSEDMAHSITQSLIETYDMFKDGAPGAKGWALDNQTYQWAVPYHDGAIKALEDAGRWTPEMQAHNDALVARQFVLQSAWGAYTKGAPSDEAAFVKGWLEARSAALTKAGMPVIFE